VSARGKDFSPEVGSYRDPSGQVFLQGDRVLRTVTRLGKEQYEHIRDSGILSTPTFADRIISSRECPGDDSLWAVAGADCTYLLEHPRVPVISYPYEWCFSALKDAALFHLQMQRDLLAQNVMLSDASAYNVQFNGAKPIFIDRLSLRAYQEGEYWIAHRQFCEQFLNPLLLHAQAHVEPNSWYRGNLEGIPTEAVASLLPQRSRLSFAMQANVFLPAAFQSRARRRNASATAAAPSRKLSKAALDGMFSQLSRLIAGLALRVDRTTTWQGYGEEPGYAADDRQAKQRFVAEFVTSRAPRLLIDLGCNTGEYSELALMHGAQAIVAIDGDHGAADAAYRRTKEKSLAINTLFVDLANESPAQGWQQSERQGLTGRFKADAVLALALVHHLALGRNIPIERVVDWIMTQAEQGVIEIPAPDDPQVKRLTAFKTSVLAGYSQAAFVDAIARRGAIVKQHTLTGSGRLLVWFGPSTNASRA
jgi:ribosomal protein L11 methylase PrmA